VDSKVDLMERDINKQLSTQRNIVDKLEAQCISLSPSFPLERGFALLFSNNKVITNEKSLKDFDKFEVVRANEKVIARVVKGK